MLKGLKGCGKGFFPQPSSFPVPNSCTLAFLRANSQALLMLKVSEFHRITEQLDSRIKVFLPYIKNVTDHIGRILQKGSLRPIFKPNQKIQQKL